MRWLVLLILAGWFTSESWLFLEIGGRIGVLAVIGWMGLSFLLGLVLLRLEGWRLLLQVHRQLQRDVVPVQEMADGAGIVLGALLLMLPGFLSDAFGVLFLIPPLRTILLRALGRVFLARWAVPSRPARVLPPSEEVVEIHPDHIEREPRFSE